MDDDSYESSSSNEDSFDLYNFEIGASHSDNSETAEEDLFEVALHPESGTEEIAIPIEQASFTMEFTDFSSDEWSEMNGRKRVT